MCTAPPVISFAAGEHLGIFHLGAIIEKAAITTLLLVFGDHCSDLSGKFPRSEIAGSKGEM